MKRVAVFGSTGSIGTQTLTIIKENPELFSVAVLTCGKNIRLFAEQLRTFHPEAAVVMQESDAEQLREAFPDIVILSGREGLVRAAAEAEYDIFLNALVGMAGLEPTWYAIQAGKTIALANKETLVAGGKLIMNAAAENNVRILPVDSEHSAVFQCLEGFDASQVRRIILTASGGPFRGMNREALAQVSLAQALNHPRWKMGSKITIDSATLMNKGFEVIEARWLFDVPAEKISVIVHPESIVHSMVEYEDGAVMAQLGLPDMKIPISLALNYPKRLKNQMPSLNFSEAARLNFEAPDFDTFICLKLAYDALKAGGTYCTALNAANEVCVAAFLEEKISYLQIGDTLQRVMEQHIPAAGDSLEEILQIDRDVRMQTKRILVLE